MKIPPKYKITPEIKKFISLIDELRNFLNSNNIKPEIKSKLNELNKLKSALYSARLAENSMTWEEAKELFLKEKQQKEGIILLPRRQEILAIIKDHKNVSFDFLKRRFFGVPGRTLRYDLKKLADQGLITKVGKTRGSFYRSRNY